MSQNIRSLALTVCEGRCFENIFTNDDFVTERMTKLFVAQARLQWVCQKIYHSQLSCLCQICLFYLRPRWGGSSTLFPHKIQQNTTNFVIVWVGGSSNSVQNLYVIIYAQPLKTNLPKYKIIPQKCYPRMPAKNNKKCEMFFYNVLQRQGLSILRSPPILGMVGVKPICSMVLNK